MADIIIIGIGLLLFIAGIRKGGILMLYEFFSLFIVFMLSISTSPYLVQVLKGSIVETKITEGVRNVINYKIPQEQITTIYDKRKIIEALEIPEIFSRAIYENNILGMYESLGGDEIREHLINYCTVALVNILAFVTTFIVFLIASGILKSLLDIINYIPVISGLNRLLGGFIGLIITYTVVSFLFLLSNIFMMTEIYRKFMAEVEVSTLGKFILVNNIFDKVILDLIIKGI